MRIKAIITWLHRTRAIGAGTARGGFHSVALAFAVSWLICLLILTMGSADPGQAASGAATAALRAGAAGQPGHHLVVLGDPHIPGKHLIIKQRVLKRIKSWADVQGIVAVGDLCADSCTAEEAAAVQAFFSGLAKSFYPIAGNHDVHYEDLPDPSGKRVRASPATVERKLRRFQEAFNLPAHHYFRIMEPYLLVFLSTDRTDALAGISTVQLAWLRGTLEAHRQKPTIIFFHAPLAGTLRSYNGYANSFHFVAQPTVAIHDLLREHRQAFLWVSGHMHTTPLEESFASPVNLYDGRVQNIHVPDMNRRQIWTVSLFLHPDRVVVRTYDHKAVAWVKELDRTVPAPLSSPSRVGTGVPEGAR
jgi:hypothetical protein